MRKVVLVLLIVAACGCGGEPPQASTTDPPPTATTTIPSPLTSSSTTTTSATSSATTADTTGTTTPAATTTTTTTTSPGLAVGGLAGTVVGWPQDAVACSAALRAWGPWPARSVEVVCRPGSTEPLPFEFPLLPAGDWAVDALVTWTDSDGTEHSRFNGFPADPRRGAGWITVSPNEQTSVDLRADRPTGAVAGMVIDDRTGEAVGGQYEPGDPLVRVVAFGEDGRLAGSGGNGCDGSYRFWLPEGRYAVGVIDPRGTWADAWVPGGEPLRYTDDLEPYFAVDPDAVPAGSWVDVADAAATDVTVRAGPGPEWRDPDPDGWWPWTAERIEDEPLPVGDPRRDARWWVGKTASTTDATEIWPPPLTVDGEPTGLGGLRTNSAAWDGNTVIVASPLPPPGASGRGGEPSFRPAYRIVLAVGGAGTITDALYLEVEPGMFVAAPGTAPHLPGADFVVLGASGDSCDTRYGQAVRAWNLVEGRFEEVDPTGIAVVPVV